MKAIETGKRLYEQFGYRVLIKIAFNSSTKNLEFELTPELFYAIWKPAAVANVPNKTNSP